MIVCLDLGLSPHDQPLNTRYERFNEHKAGNHCSRLRSATDPTLLRVILHSRVDSAALPG